MKKSLLTISLLLLSFSTAVIADNTYLIDSLYQNGLIFIEAGNFEKAVPQFLEVEKLQPDYKQVRSNLVKAYKFTGMLMYQNYEYEKAIENWEQALKIDPDESQIRKFIDRTYNEMKAYNGIDSTDEDIIPVAPLPDNYTVGKKDTVIVYKKKIIRDTVIIEQPPVTIIKKSPVKTGIGGGLTVNKESDLIDQNTGYHFNGNISVLADRLPLGLRFDYLYYKSTSKQIDDSIDKKLSVNGVSISGVLWLGTLEKYNILGRGGVGYYDCTMLDNSTPLIADYYRSAKTSGYHFGLGLEKNYGTFSALVEFQFLKIDKYYIPDLFFFTIGIKVG